MVYKNVTSSFGPSQSSGPDISRYKLSKLVGSSQGGCYGILLVVCGYISHGILMQLFFGIT